MSANAYAQTLGVAHVWSGYAGRYVSFELKAVFAFFRRGIVVA
jgi:hypothetical protein